MQNIDRENIDLSVVERIVLETGREASFLLPILQKVQKHFKYLPEEALLRICEITEISQAELTSVATFYTQFRHKPAGKHIIRVCHGTACHVKGAEYITDSVRRYLKLNDGEDTDINRMFTVEKAACFGCCTLAPVVKIDEMTYGKVTSRFVPEMINLFLWTKAEGSKKNKPEEENKLPDSKAVIKIGLGSCCVAGGSRDVKNAFDKYIFENSLEAVTKRVGCTGMCHSTPFVEVAGSDGKPVYYVGVNTDEVKLICDKHLKPAATLKKLINTVKRGLDLISFGYYDGPSHANSVKLEEGGASAFLAPQRRIVLENSGEINPLDINEYRAKGGFKALLKVIKNMKPEEIIEEIKNSGLRGRGGAGFPSGIKWETVKQAPAGKKYIICNGDEGDPGAFMDRMLLESHPYRVLEGLIIAAFALGIDEGYFYIRDEYPLALDNIEKAVGECEKAGFLGKNILGSGFSLKIHMFRGAGAFIGGEETALMASIEGRRGMPNFRPPYPAEKGLFGCPTNINNVETYASVPWIINNGSTVYSRIGTKSSCGTKVFALAGKVERGGLIEVPLGISIREVVEGIGGGVKKGRKFKAVQIGGPSGGCIPSNIADLPIDFEEITNTGSIMGSGGLVVLDDTDCMVDFARFFLEFTQSQSCGKCTFCRIGTKRMLEILTKLCKGEGKLADIDKLEELGRSVKTGSLCGLGKTAPNPVLTAIKYFKEEYIAHTERKCPAKKCKELIKYSVNDKCIGCTLCAQVCPSEALSAKPFEKHEVNQEKCIKCDSCRAVCLSEAIDVTS
ncbi:MAG: NAD(P)H-dependent oxidoreductase subunit E [Candidatus Firestonebacteria bacterium]